MTRKIFTLLFLWFILASCGKEEIVIENTSSGDSLTQEEQQIIESFKSDLDTLINSEE